MREPHFLTLTERLDRLERENRRWRRAGTGVLIVIAAFALMGQAIQGRVPKAMEAERFVLRDTGGRVRAALGMEADGSVGLWLLDSAGKTRAGVGVSREGSPVMALADQTGKVTPFADTDRRPWPQSPRPG